MKLTQAVYAVTKLLPPDERYGLVSQMNRAAVSVPSNIAEGSQRTTTKDISHYIRIAKGSLIELETQALLCRELFATCNDEIMIPLLTDIQELKKMISGFQKSLVSSK